VALCHIHGRCSYRTLDVDINTVNNGHPLMIRNAEQKPPFEHLREFIAALLPRFRIRPYPRKTGDRAEECPVVGEGFVRGMPQGCLDTQL